MKLCAAPSTPTLAFAFVAGGSCTGVLCGALWIYGFGLDVLAWGAAGAFRVVAFVALLTSTMSGIAFGLTLHGIRKKASRVTSARPRLAASGFGGVAFLAAVGAQFVLPMSIASSLVVFTVMGVAAAEVYRRLHLVPHSH